MCRGGVANRERECFGRETGKIDAELKTFQDNMEVVTLVIRKYIGNNISSLLLHFGTQTSLQIKFQAKTKTRTEKLILHP